MFHFGFPQTTKDHKRTRLWSKEEEEGGREGGRNGNLIWMKENEEEAGWLVDGWAWGSVRVVSFP